LAHPGHSIPETKRDGENQAMWMPTYSSVFYQYDA